MPVGAGISAAASIGSSLIGASAADRAADKQAQAAQAALAQQQAMYNEAKSNVQPYLDFGKSAATSLSQLYGLTTPDNPGGAQSVNSAWNAFQNLPAYQFPYQQGLLALTRNLNAQGLNMSGAATKEAQQYGQGLASQYLMSNYVTPLTQFASLGQGSANSLLTGSANFANTLGNTQMGIGQAQASGIVGSANALGGGLNNAGSSLALYSALGKNGAAQNNNNPVGGGLSSYTNSNIWLPNPSNPWGG